jgi:formate hydrogenlyase subunit 3/multisubunit Na+/H+ antiporter MnhD subunit
MGEILRWLVCILMGVPCALALVGNWLFLIGTLWTKKPTSMVFPFIAGLLGAAACLICPVERVQWLAWYPVVLDVGILGFLFAVATGRGFGRR